MGNRFASDLRGTKQPAFNVPAGVSSGSPSSGIYMKGDYYMDLDGIVYFCTTSGSPGIWESVQFSPVSWNELQDVPISSSQISNIAYKNESNIFLEPQQFIDGSGSSPSITFSGSTNVGIYRKETGSGGISFSIGGSNVLSVDRTNSEIITVGDGNISSGVVLNGPVGTNRTFTFQSSGSSRWIIATNQNTESGSNLGSNFVLSSRNDDGTSLATNVFFATRSTGFIGMGNTSPTSRLQITGTLRMDSGVAFNMLLVPERTTNDRKLTFENSTSTTTGGWQFYASNAAFSSSPVVLIVQNNGKIGMGTASPTTARLVVEDNTGFVADFRTATSSTTGPFSMNRMSRLTNVVGRGGGITFFMQNDSNSEVEYARFSSLIESNYSGSHSGALVFYVTKAGSVTQEVMRVSGSVGNVGIGTISPSAKLDITGQTNSIQLLVKGNSTQTANITEWQTSTSLVLALITGTGGAVFNENGTATGDFRVESDTEPEMIFVDANADTDGALYLGGTTNGVKISKGGDILLLGTATGWKDVYFPMAPPKATGAGNPTIVTLVGNLRGYSFAVDDIHDFDPQEFPHDGKENSTITWHIHWISRTNVAATRGVKWEIEYTFATANGIVNSTSTSSVDITVPANTNALQHFVTDITTQTPSGVGPASIFLVRLKRVASATTAPANDPVVCGIHFHYEVDTPQGSRTITNK